VVEVVVVFETGSCVAVVTPSFRSAGPWVGLSVWTTLLMRTESAWTELAVKSDVTKTSAVNALTVRLRRGVILKVLEWGKFILFNYRKSANDPQTPAL
jgi:hypothetical protein